MVLSSGVVWRYREWETFSAECPGGDPALQRVVWDRLDGALAWLESGSAGGGAGDRQPADHRGALRSAGPDARAGERRSPRGAAARAPQRRADDPRHRRFPGRRRARPSAHHPRAPRAQGEPVEHRRRPAAGSGPRRRALPGDGRVLREEPRGRSADRARGLRAARPGLRARHAVVENAAASASRRATGPTSTSSSGRPDSRARAPGTSCRTRRWRSRCATHGRAGHRGRPRGRRAGRAPRRRQRGSGRRRDHDDPRRHPGRRAGRVADGLWAAGADVGGISTGGWSSALAAALVLGKPPPRTPSATPCYGSVRRPGGRRRAARRPAAARAELRDGEARALVQLDRRSRRGRLAVALGSS